MVDGKQSGLGDSGQGDGDGSGKWYEALSAEYRSDEHVTGHDTLESFVKQGVNAQHLLGRKGIIPPGEGATEADYAKFFNDLGRPADRFEGYRVEDFPKVERPSGVPEDQEFESALLKAVYDAGAPQDMAERLYASYLGAVEPAHRARMEALNEEHAKIDRWLDETYGYAADRVLQQGTQAFEAIGRHLGMTEEKGLKDWMGALDLPMANGTSLGQQPFLMQMMKMVAEAGGEGSILKSSAGQQVRTFEMSREDAQKELDQLMSDGEFRKKFFDSEHPEHKTAIEQRDALYNVIYQ